MSRYHCFDQTTRVARKNHVCIWCGQQIEQATSYVHEQSIYDGRFQNHKWHPECWDASQKEFSCSCYGTEFDPGDNERPVSGQVVSG